MGQKYLSTGAAKQFFTALFEKIEVPPRIYQPVVEGLVETSLRGVDSHGIRLIPHYIRAAQLGRINKKPRYTFRQTSPATIVMNADHTYGITAGNVGMRKAVKLAATNGIGAVAVKNSSHFGAAALHSLIAARQGMIGLSFTHVEDLVLPFGGRIPFLGTNPICFAAPCQQEEPFCLDMATTQISFNQLLMHKQLGRILAEGCAADENGKQTTDPATAVHLLHFGGYKGYGLALMIEVLCSLLTGMNYGPYLKHMYPLDKEKRRLGHFFLAIAISKFVSLEKFKQRIQKLIDELRAIPPAAGFAKVRVAGDPEKEIFLIRKKEGIPISRVELKQFREIADEVGLEKKYSFYV